MNPSSNDPRGSRCRLSASPPSRNLQRSSAARGLSAIVASVIALMISLPMASHAQQAKATDAGAERATLTAVGLMKRGQWNEALSIFNQIIGEWGNDAFYQKLPAFGTVYYNRGFCEMKLRQYPEAVESFKKCHEDFSDDIAEGEANSTSNVYWKTAVFQWAAAEQYQENYEEAIKRYLQFMNLQPTAAKDQFNPAVYHINLGICYAKIDDRTNAESNVAKAFGLARRYRLPISSLWPGFLAVLESYVRAEGDEEAAGASAFVDKFSPVLLTEPLPHGYYSSRILKLAQDAVATDLVGLGWRLYGLVPKTDAVLLAGRLADPSQISAAEKRAIETFQQKKDSGEPLEIATYFGLSKLYESVGDTRAQFAIYDYMGTHFLKTQYRPSILYLATKTASEIGEMADAQRHGLNFLDEFPDHELAPDVSALLLSSMFFNGEYERCIEIAGDLRPNFSVGSAQRDLPDFVYSGSLYYLGRYVEAQPELDSHVENYPESPYKENSTYYQASNLIKLYEWQRAATLLDAWLAIYEPEESALLDVAYLDRGTCHFALSTPQNNGNAKALEFADKIIENFPQSAVLDRAHRLRGDVQQNDGNFPGAEKSYLTSKEIAEEEDHFSTAASALMQLVAVAAAQEEHGKAIKYYDEFFDKYPDTFYAPNAAVAVLNSIKEAEPVRLDDTLKRIQDIIFRLGQSDDSDGVEATLNAYTNFLLREKPAEEVIDILDNFPKELGLKTMQAWLLITKIGIIEERLAEEGKMIARAKVYYESLENDFDKEDLGDFILYQLGVKIAEANPFKAQPWFEQVAQSQDPEMAMRAQLRLAMIRANSESKADQDTAIADLKRIRTNLHENPEIVGSATLALARLFHERQNWKEANDEWQAYMENKSYREARPEALFKLGESYERLGKLDEALVSYSQLTVLYSGYLELSAEAVNRIAKIVWDRGDREKAFKFINTFHFRMKANDHPKVRAMGQLRENYLNDLKAKGEWKEEFLQVRDTFGQIKPASSTTK